MRARSEDNKVGIVTPGVASVHSVSAGQSDVAFQIANGIHDGVVCANRDEALTVVERTHDDR